MNCSREPRLDAPSGDISLGGSLCKTLIVIHRWVALTVGVILFGIAASGAALVFERLAIAIRSIDRSRPRAARSQPAGPAGASRPSFDAVAAAAREAQLGTRLDNLKRSLHTGDVLGISTEVVWLLAVLALCSQVIPGALMWWNARRGR